MKEFIRILRQIKREDPELYPAAFFLARFGKPGAFLDANTNLQTFLNMRKYAIPAYETERKWVTNECEQLIALLVARGLLSFTDGSDRQKYVLTATGTVSRHMIKNGRHTTTEATRLPWREDPSILDKISPDLRERIESFSTRSRRLVQCQEGWIDAMIKGIGLDE